MADPVFFPVVRTMTVREIAVMVGGELSDGASGASVVEGLAPADEGGRGRLVFVDGRRNRALMERLTATAVLCQPELAPLAPQGVAVITVRAPAAAFARVGRALHPQAVRPGPVLDIAGISPAAWIAPDALIEDGATVEAGAMIGARAEIGSGAVIGPGAVVGSECRIGRDCYVGPGASVVAALIGNRVIIHAGARIGQDGFGFVPGKAGLEKVPQIGRVIIQDDVEIGANTAIDRGALGDTVIGEGTKIDNLVQVGHNTRIGRHCAIAGQVGISGSVSIGSFVMLGGGVGIADHLTIGDGAQIAAGSGLADNVPAGERWGGTPAGPLVQGLRDRHTLAKIIARERRKES